jgi:hypothetical protein
MNMENAKPEASTMNNQDQTTQTKTQDNPNLLRLVEAGILNQSSAIRTNIPTNQPNSIAIRRPQPETPYQEQIDKTIEKAKIEGKRPNTLKITSTPLQTVLKKVKEIALTNLIFRYGAR